MGCGFASFFLRGTLCGLLLPICRGMSGSFARKDVCARLSLSSPVCIYICIHRHMMLFSARTRARTRGCSHPLFLRFLFSSAACVVSLLFFGRGSSSFFFVEEEKYFSNFEIERYVSLI